MCPIREQKRKRELDAKKSKMSGLRKILNSSGFSYLDGILALAMAGVVSLGVISLSAVSNKQSITARQNHIMDSYIRGLRDYMGDKESCDLVLRDDSGTLVADVSSYLGDDEIKTQLDGKLSIEHDLTQVLLPSIPDSGRAVLPVNIYVYFNRNLQSNSGTAKTNPVKRTTASVVFEDGRYAGCSDFEEEAKRSAFTLACETLGGIASFPESGYNCDLANIDPRHPFIAETKRKVCSQIYNNGSILQNGKCVEMNMPNTPTVASNINENSFQLGLGRVRTYVQSCDGTNNFAVGKFADGTLRCKTVRRCTKGDASCP